MSLTLIDDGKSRGSAGTGTKGPTPRAGAGIGARPGIAAGASVVLAETSVRR